MGSLDVQALVSLLNRVLSLQTLDSGRFDRAQKFNTRMSSRILRPSGPGLLLAADEAIEERCLLLHCMSPHLALNGHLNHADECPFSGANRKTFTHSKPHHRNRIKHYGAPTNNLFFPSFCRSGRQGSGCTIVGEGAVRQFNVGQVVTYIPDMFLRHAASGNYRVVAAMPDRDGNQMYRIKSPLEEYERVVKETFLVKSDGYLPEEAPKQSSRRRSITLPTLAATASFQRALALMIRPTLIVRRARHSRRHSIR